jgi:DNA-3-methyladenine glycosylase
MPKSKSILSASFYQDADVVSVAQQLLGKLLVVNKNGNRRSAIITETEAYRAPEDKASHAFNFRRTPRTEIMYQAGGHAYVYLCYGIHRLFNVITGPENMPHAVLIRSVLPVDGLDSMFESRKITNLEPRLSSGPGSMSAAMGIEMSDNGSALWDHEGTISIYENTVETPPFEIAAGPRIGVDYAEEWADKHWRFWISKSQWVSRRDKAKLYE